MIFLPVVDNIHMKGRVSQIIDTGPRFDFITKKGETCCYFFLGIYSSFHKMRTKIYIKILRHLPLHIYHKNKQ